MAGDARAARIAPWSSGQGSEALDRTRDQPRRDLVAAVRICPGLSLSPPDDCAQLGTTVLSHKEIQGLRNADEPFRVSSDEFTVEINKLLPGGDGEDLASGMRSDTVQGEVGPPSEVR